MTDVTVDALRSIKRRAGWAVEFSDAESLSDADPSFALWFLQNAYATADTALRTYCVRCNWERDKHDGTAGVACPEFQGEAHD